MRIDGTVTSISWIPSEAVTGMAKLPFGGHVAHYDPPPPDALGSDQRATLDELRDADRFRFANHLTAWIEVDDGRIVDAGYSGGGLIGSTTIGLGAASVTVAAVGLPDVCSEPEIGDGWARFTQISGGRTGVPAPRTVRHKPYIQYHAPIAWSTLQLTIHVDGRVEGALTGASPFPRHWVYDSDGNLIAKSGLVDFKDWFKNAFGTHTPWGDLDSPALVTAVETALERELSTVVMRRGAKPKIKQVKEGGVLVEQGDPGDELFVLLDGVLSVEHDGIELGALGPGSVFGERAVLENGTRTATLRAMTKCKVAVAARGVIDLEKLEQLVEGHRREETR
jgi:hypothetical protein